MLIALSLVLGVSLVLAPQARPHRAAGTLPTVC